MTKKRGRPTIYAENTKWLRDIYNNKKNEIDGFSSITVQQFIAWFDQNKFDEGCCYCGTTNETSRKIFDFQINNGRNNATRGEKRMRRLELERIIPNEPYDNLSNLAWACHWCNNAKSNFFTAEEFKPLISTAIRTIIDKISNEIDELSMKNKKNENI
jgi:hypothetical protein